MSQCFKVLCVATVLLWDVSGAVTILIRPEIQYQTIIGFGGHDPRDQVDRLVNDLGMSAYRDWINCEVTGGSGTGWNQLRELYNAGVRCFIGSPWSPPAHMKYVNNCSGTDTYWNRLSNGLGPGNSYQYPNADPERGGLRNFYPDFAAHLAKYAKDFRANVGIDLYAISPQNEPAFAQTFPSCVYNRHQLRDIVWEIGRRFEQEGLSHVKIFAAEDMLTNFNATPYIQTIWADTATRRYLGAAAVHGYSDGVSPAPTSSLAAAWGGRSGVGTFAWQRGLQCWQTEISGYINWDGGACPEGGTCPGARALGTSMFIALKHGKISGWWWWRLAVTESYWTDETLIYNGTPNKNYYVSKIFYKYIRPGAVMVHVNDSADTSMGAVAFWHKQNRTLTMVFINSSTSSKNVTITGVLPASMDMYVTSATQDFARTGTVSGNSFTLPASCLATLYGTNYDPPLAVLGETRHGRLTLGALRGETTVRIYDAGGRLVRTTRQYRPAGETTGWDGLLDNGLRASPGAYLAVLQDDEGRTVHTPAVVAPR